MRAPVPNIRLNHGFIFMLKPTAVYASKNTKKALYGPVPGVGIKMREGINEMVFHTDSLEVVGFYSSMGYLSSLVQEYLSAKLITSRVNPKKVVDMSQEYEIIEENPQVNVVPASSSAQVEELG